MKYKSLKVKNYKGIKEVEIDFSHNRILTLVGLNESGKTTILDAINLFYSLIKDKKLSSKELNEIRPKGIGFTGDIILSGSLEFEAADYSVLDNFLLTQGKKTKVVYPKEFNFTYEFHYEVHTYKRTRTTSLFEAKSSSQTKDTLHKTNNPLWNLLVNNIKASLIPEILYFEDFIFEIPDQISFDITPETSDNTALEKEWKLVFDDILRSVDSKFSTFQKYVVEIWKTDNDTARQRLAAMEKKLDKKITNSWKELFSDVEKKENQRLNFKEIKLVPVSENSGKVSFSFKVKTESGKEFSLNERSKGCKWFFSFLIFTEFRKSRTNNILFLLDEPASNLHSSAQLKILDAISALSDKSVIVYSTHSHHLINPIWLNGAYVVINEGISTENLEGALTDDDAKITVEKYFNYVSTKNQNFQPLYFQPILDRFDYKPSFIDPMPKVVISEGKYDWYTFKYVNEIILKNKFKLNFYPGKGAESNDEILRLYFAWGSKFVLLLDSDTSGTAAKKKYVKDFGSLIEDKVFSYEDILNKKITTEEIFLAEDIKLICDAAFGKNSYSKISDSKSKIKSTFNFALSQLLTSKTEVSIHADTVSKFVTIFNFLNSKL